MRWELWRPWYDGIVRRLNLDIAADEAAAKILNDILPKPEIEKLTSLVKEKECIVLGAGPSLDDDIEKLERAGFLNKTLIAADGATSAVLEYRNPKIIVTDLDGVVKDQLEAWQRGSWIVVHAHGDNIAQIRKIVPKLKERVVGTTQVEPFGKLYNFGGFTDGDRAAFIAHELGASKIYLAGMDLGSKIGRHSGDKDVKRKLIKLKICRELLAWLAGELGANLINLTSHGEPI
ncbi:MAG: 6-hydroxymethyl-7,8-dihydropterin pyrophosphokinase, partial [Hadesarchaea archaeon CG08_land_8_20_14_0_20_51_8]